MNSEPTIVAVPYFPGSPWKLGQIMPLHDYPLRTMRLPAAPAERRGS
jgi:hypothetical protein